MSGIDYRHLRASISMRMVLALLGYEPTRIRGPQWRGPCPLHGDDAATAGSPRRRAATCFSVHLDQQAYRCFACGSQGNQLDLWAAARRLPLHAAALDLCQTTQLPPPTLTVPIPKHITRPAPGRETGPV